MSGIDESEYVEIVVLLTNLYSTASLLPFSWFGSKSSGFKDRRNGLCHSEPLTYSLFRA